MKLALLTAQVSPSAGGLAYSVPGLSRELNKLNEVEARVFGAFDSKFPDALTDWGPNVKGFKCVGPQKLSFAPTMINGLRHFNPDVVDVQGLWSGASWVGVKYFRKTGKRYVVTPRGMLDPWARNRSVWKKRLARMWFEDANLENAACLRATAEMEALHFRSFGLKNPIAIVPNGVEVPGTLVPRRHGKMRRLLFLSRIHPKKGLEHLLRAWVDLAADRQNWELVIAGPDELNHTAEMKFLAKRLGAQRVIWSGPVQGREKSKLYRSADLFVLPTHAENFGLVVAEALAHEVPVVTTKNAPWKGLTENSCGWWINLEHGQLRDAISVATSMPIQDLWQMGARGRSWIAREFAWDHIGGQMLSLYRWVAGTGPKPNFVC